LQMLPRKCWQVPDSNVGVKVTRSGLFQSSSGL
jgi:hypothetical protein